MKKVIIVITSIILCLSTSLSIYLFVQYSDNSIKVNNLKKDINKVEVKIKKSEGNINNKNEEIKKVQEKNSSKASMLEAWQKELKKVKNS